MWFWLNSVLQSQPASHSKTPSNSSVSSVRNLKLDTVSQSHWKNAGQLPWLTRLSQTAPSKYGKLTDPLFPQRPNR